MKWALCILLWVLSTSIVYVESDGGQCTNPITSNTLQLKRKLLCDYDPEVRPVKEHTNITEVRYNMFVGAFNFDEQTNTLEISSWINMRWRDEHLSWDKADYNGLKYTPVRCSRLWVPDVALLNKYKSGESTVANMNNCMLDSTGQITTGFPILVSATCVPDILRWPFDQHTCTFKVGSWSYYGNQINITFNEKVVFTKNYISSRDWDLLNSNAVRYVRQFSSRNLTWPGIQYTFELQRHAGGYAATVFIPAVVLAMMTLLTFWLEPGDIERLHLMYVNIVCHCLYMIYMGTRLPGNGDKTPLIVTFFRDSFLLSGISLLVSFCVRRMTTAARAAPAWITYINDRILATTPGQLLLLGETDPKGVAAALDSGDAGDGVTLVNEPPTAEGKGWRLFAILIDRLCFLTYTITLVILLSAFIPRAA